MFYFENFPRVDYATLGSSIVNATDITKRFKFIDKVLTNKYIMYSYIVKEHERPDMIAHKYYGDSTLDWMIFLINKLLDPYFEWPLTNYEFNQYIKKKYGSLETPQQTIKAYYQIIQAKSVTYDGYVVPEYSVQIDLDTFNNTPVSNRRSISVYDFEQQLNENRKTIKLIDKAFLPKILDETKKIFD